MQLAWNSYQLQNQDCAYLPSLCNAKKILPLSSKVGEKLLIKNNSPR